MFEYVSSCDKLTYLKEIKGYSIKKQLTGPWLPKVLKQPGLVMVDVLSTKSQSSPPFPPY